MNHKELHVHKHTSTRSLQTTNNVDTPRLTAAFCGRIANSKVKFERTVDVMFCAPNKSRLCKQEKYCLSLSHTHKNPYLRDIYGCCWCGACRTSVRIVCGHHTKNYCISERYSHAKTRRFNYSITEFSVCFSVAFCAKALLRKVPVVKPEIL